MNFKPTPLKIIVSIIVTLILNFFAMVLFAGCVGFFNCYFDALIELWYAWIIIIIIIYSIWSLIQKNK